MANIPHLYRKLLDILRERTPQRYVRRKTLYANAAQGFHITKHDVDIAMKELERKKAVKPGRHGVWIE